MIDWNEFKAYNDEVARLGNEAASNVEESIMGWCREHESATVAEKREAAKLIMEGFVQAYDDTAAKFAADWYDYRAEKSRARSGNNHDHVQPRIGGRRGALPGEEAAQRR